MNVNPPTRDYAWPSLSLDIQAMLRTLADQRRAGVVYNLGAKIPLKPNLVPGKDYKSVDCSGEVRFLLWVASGGRVVLPDGSWIQHQAVKKAGFKKSSVDSAKLQDGVLRIAFLDPNDSHSHIGHVVLVLNGETLESHGSHGPNRRAWNGTGWQEKASVYVLTAP
jgi:hypothetical protein